MKKTIASVALSLALMSSTAMAEERGGDAALGALSGAVVLGPIGAVAGAFAFVGPEPLERAAPCAESRKPGRSCPFRRQSTRAQSVCAQRSSSSSSGRPSAAVHHHHGFHRAAGPVTGMSRYYC
jgi:hypothetical protein